MALELAYALELLTRTDVAQGLRLSAQVRVHRLWTVYVGYRFEARVAVDNGDDSVELQRHPLDAGVRFRWWLGAFELAGQAGLGFSYSRLFQRLPATSSNAAKTTADWLVFLDAQVHLGVRPLPRLLLFAGVGARFYAKNARYQFAPDDVLLAPWPVQPSFRVGLTVDLF